MKTPRILVASASLLSLASVCLAGGGEGGHETASVLPSPAQGLVPLVTALVVFLVVLAVLSVAVWPKILKGLKDRENKIRDEIQSAELARKQAKDALEQYESSLREARAKAQKMLDKARAQQQAMLDEMKAKNEAELNAMRDKARRDIDVAKRDALSEIYAITGDLAVSAASKILRREVNASDSRRLVDESMAQLVKH
jgi:F-type H+-transporting ATPase subunit b